MNAEQMKTLVDRLEAVHSAVEPDSRSAHNQHEYDVLYEGLKSKCVQIEFALWELDSGLKSLWRDIEQFHRSYTACKKALEIGPKACDVEKTKLRLTELEKFELEYQVLSKERQQLGGILKLLERGPNNDTLIEQLSVRRTVFQEKCEKAVGNWHSLLQK